MRSEHTNSEGERIDIHQIDRGDFKGQFVLSIWDDPPPKGKGIRAPMLCDSGTQKWLREQLAHMDPTATFANWRDTLSAADVQYLVGRLRRVIELIQSGDTNMAIAKLLADISALTGPNNAQISP